MSDGERWVLYFVASILVNDKEGYINYYNEAVYLIKNNIELKEIFLLIENFKVKDE